MDFGKLVRARRETDSDAEPVFEAVLRLDEGGWKDLAGGPAHLGAPSGAEGRQVYTITAQMTARLQRRPGSFWARLFTTIMTIIVYLGWNLEINRPFTLPSFYDTQVWLIAGLTVTYWFNFSTSHLYYATYTTLSRRVGFWRIILAMCIAFYESPLIAKSLVLNGTGAVTVLIILLVRNVYTDMVFIILLYLELFFSKPFMDILVQLSQFYTLVPRPALIDEDLAPGTVALPVTGAVTLRAQEHLRNVCLVETHASDYRVDYGRPSEGFNAAAMRTVSVSGAREAAVVYPAKFSFWKNQLQQFAFVFDGKYTVYAFLDPRMYASIERAYLDRFYSN